MEDSDSTKHDKLSNLARDLEAIEGSEGGVENPAELNAARDAVISAIEGVFESHYQFATSLDHYRAFFKAKHTWTTALEKIASVQGCSARTLYRLLENYEATKQLPLYFIDAMLEAGIDPAVTGNREVVQALASVPKPVSVAEAEASVNLVRSNVISMKRAVESSPSEVEEFARRIVRMFEARYRSYQGADRDDQIRFILEKVVNVLRADVRELHTYSRPDHVRKPAKGAC